jgi:hypothetical protein
LTGFACGSESRCDSAFIRVLQCQASTAVEMSMMYIVEKAVTQALATSSGTDLTRCSIAANWLPFIAIDETRQLKERCSSPMAMQNTGSASRTRFCLKM